MNTISRNIGKVDIDSKRKFTPEQNMIAEMIKNAISDLRDHDARIRERAYRWINSDSDRQWGFLWSMAAIDMEEGIGIFRVKAQDLYELIDEVDTMCAQTNQKRQRGSCNADYELFVYDLEEYWV